MMAEPEQGLRAKIAALPAEERAARYLQVIHEQGLSMATQKRWLDEKDEKIVALERQLAEADAAIAKADSEGICDTDHDELRWWNEAVERHDLCSAATSGEDGAQ